MTNPYKNTNSITWYMSPLELIETPDDDTDTFYTITTTYNLKPGKFCYDTYGDSTYAFVLKQMNQEILRDMIFDFKAGTIIRIPTKVKMLKMVGA
jgi:hypothetical protein